MMDWMTTVPTCFGSDDLVLGSHDDDEQRTRTMIAEARGTGSTADDFRCAVRVNVDSQGVQADHMTSQLVKLEEYLAAG